MTTATGSCNLRRLKLLGLKFCGLVEALNRGPNVSENAPVWVELVEPPQSEVEKQWGGSWPVTGIGTGSIG